ncbi:EmrB/QacA subfamily drug resistance transporter [Streptosporangium album]|uniref:EmrB/QacA subfamily drug resistance transporter n=1 Tax=Streptosporangium album TaxID=47479 RepID=A0A7W7RUV5_9ACTN|nr:MFS transporter [Streptosporangium album]MBB4938567.1 EmrB/QacA subfamily drug resistance transporter [Streptosporangium album]
MTLSQQVGHRPGITLAAVAVAGTMLPISVMAPALALSALGRELSAGLVGQQWVLHGYNVAFAACMLPAGALADRFGRRRVFTLGTLLFALASLVCAAAQTILVMDLARVVQGAAATGVLTAGSAVLAATFEGKSRARAFGVLGTAFGAGIAFGPIVGGGLLALGGWRAVFLSNVVVGVAVVALGVPHLRESRDPGATRFDRAGALTFTGALALFTLATVEGPQLGWMDGGVLAMFAGAAGLLLIFVRIELRNIRPMLDLNLLRDRRFLAVIWMVFAMGFGFVAPGTYLPLYLRSVGGAGPLEAGLSIAPLGLPVLLAPAAAGILIRRFSLRALLTVSLILIATGDLWLVTLTPAGGWVQLAGPLSVLGLGVGLAFGLIDNAAVSAAPPEQAGMASGVFNTMRLAGEAVAVSVTGALLISLTQSGLDGDRDLANHLAAGDLAGAPSQAVGVYTDSLHLTLLVISLFTAVSAAVFLLLHRRSR